MMTYRVLDNMRMKHCTKLLKRRDSDHSINRVITHPPDVKISSHNKVSYLLKELVDVCTNKDTIILLVQYYENYCIKLSVCGDEITGTI